MTWKSPRPVCSSQLAALVALVLMLGLACMVGGEAAWQAEPATEYDLKAHFLCLLPNYVTAWPNNLRPDASKEIVIGVLGQDPFGDKLDKAAASRSKKGKPISVLRFSTVAEFKPCHILFIAPETGANDTATQRLREWQQKVPRPWPILVTDSDALASEGVHVFLYLQANRRLAFAVNLEALRQGEIRFDPSFLSLSKQPPRRGNEG